MGLGIWAGRWDSWWDSQLDRHVFTEWVNYFGWPDDYRRLLSKTVKAEIATIARNCCKDSSTQKAPADKTVVRHVPTLNVSTFAVIYHPNIPVGRFKQKRLHASLQHTGCTQTTPLPSLTTRCTCAAPALALTLVLSSSWVIWLRLCRL